MSNEPLMQDKLNRIRRMPERTVEELRSKVNCFQAEALDLRNKARAKVLDMLRDADMYDTWAQVTFMKLRDAILKRRLK